jgi:hypothetical protein
MISFRILRWIVLAAIVNQVAWAKPIGDLSGRYTVEVPGPWTLYKPNDTDQGAGAVTYAKPNQKGFVSLMTITRKPTEAPQNLDTLIQTLASRTDVSEGKSQTSNCTLDGEPSRLFQAVTKDGFMVAILVSQKRLTSAIVIYRCQDSRDYQTVLRAAMDGFHWRK